MNPEIHERALESWDCAKRTADLLEPICEGEPADLKLAEKILNAARETNARAQMLFNRVVGETPPKTGR
jgi:hypothetical protein